MKTAWLERGGALGLSLMAAALFASLSYGITEEIQLGSVEGTVFLQDGKKPLPNCEVVLQPQFALPEGVRWNPSVRANAQGKFELSRLPAGIYEAQAYGKAHSASGVQIVVKANGTTTSTIKAEQSVPAMDLRVSQRVLAPGEKVTFEMTGITQDKEVKLAIFQVGQEAFKTAGSLYEVAQSLAMGRSSQNPTLTPGLKKVREVVKPIDSGDLEGAFAESETLDSLKEGIYLLRARHSTGERMAWLTVTSLALVTKSVDRSLLAYAVDIKTGLPAPGVPITLFANKQVSEVGKTNADGMARFDRPSVAGANFFVVGASRGASRAFTWFRAWDEGSQSSQRSSSWVKLDRPIYRPGDLIQAKGFVRIPQSGGYSTPTDGSALVRVFDPNEEEVTRQTLPLTSFGTYSFQFTSNPQLSGSYRIETTYGGSSSSRYVTVMPFRKPEYTISVTPEKKNYRRGQPIKVTVKAEYYTGEPVAGAPVSLEVNRTPTYESSGIGSWDAGSSSYLDSLEGRTGANGEAVLTYRPDPEMWPDEPLDQEVSFTASVADASQRSFSGSGSALVTRGMVDLRLEASSWIIERGQENKFTASAKDLETGAIPSAPIKVTLQRVRWLNRASSSSKEVLTDLEAKEVTAAPGTGKVDLSFSPSQEGTYRVKAEIKDSEGVRVLAESEFWCSSDTWDGDGLTAQMQIIPDKEEFTPKESVQGIIKADKPGGKALLTVEGQDLIKAQVIELKSKVTRFDLGSLGAIAPGAEIKVAYIKDKEWFESSTQVRISLKDRSLDIDIKPSVPTAKPGDTVTYTLHAATPEGEPVEAELTLGVVDEGIYQMASDDDGPLSAFYTPQWSSIQTEYSFPDLYLDGEDKGAKNVKLRTNFVDTAAWAPHVKTNAQGLATFEVTMPDNLTSWRATVTAVTADSRMGQAASNLIVKKDLMARLNAPAYMVSGDEHQVGAVITNTTDQAQVVSLDLDAQGLTIEGDHRREIQVDPRGSKRVEFTVQAPEFGKGALTLTARAKSGLNDGLRTEVEIAPAALTKVSGEAGGFTDQSSRVVSLSGDPSAVDGTLEVRVDPSPLAVVYDLLPGLVDFPYGCVEQTLSRFQPALAVQDLLKKSGLPSPIPSDKMAKVTKEGMDRLRLLQQPNGGWGWFEADSSSSLMTAAALEGLFYAQRAGVTVSPAMVRRALEWTDQRLNGPRVTSWDENTPYLAYARCLWGPTPRALTALREEAQRQAKAKAGTPSLAEMAFIATALRRAGAVEEGSQAYSRFRTRLADNPDEVLRETYFWGETKGRVLEAQALYEPQSPLTDQVISLVFRDRKALENGGTRSVALAINGLVQSLSAKGWEPATGDAQVEVMGERKSASFGPGSTDSLVLNLPFDKIKGEKLEVKVTSTLPGAFYRVSLKEKVKSDSFPALEGPKYSVTRSLHRIITKNNGDGTMTRISEEDGRTSFKSGEVYRVRLVINAERDLNYLLIEDPIPSGASVVESGDYSEDRSSLWWDSTMQLKDKVAFFKRSLPKGRHLFEYRVRAETPGTSLALPAEVSLFYEPLEPARTSGVKLSIEP